MGEKFFVAGGVAFSANANCKIEREKAGRSRPS